MSAMQRRLLPGLVAVALVIGAAACGGGDDDTSAPPPSTTTTTLPDMPADYDWWHPPDEVSLGGEWVLKPCEGDDPTLCYEHADGRRGTVELYRFAAPADPNLNAHAAKFVEDFLADRRAGCGAEYRVTAEPIDPLELPDGPGRRYGFAGGATGAPDTERTIQWAGIRDIALVIVTISAYDPGACVAAEGEGTLEDLEEILPGLHALIQASGLPDPAGP
jgi:hypothetical protein